MIVEISAVRNNKTVLISCDKPEVITAIPNVPITVIIGLNTFKSTENTTTNPDNLLTDMEVAANLIRTQALIVELSNQIETTTNSDSLLAEVEIASNLIRTQSFIIKTQN